MVLVSYCLGFIRDNDKINAILARPGFFILVETDFQASSLEIKNQRDILNTCGLPADDLPGWLDALSV